MPIQLSETRLEPLSSLKSIWTFNVISHYKIVFDVNLENNLTQSSQLLFFFTDHNFAIKLIFNQIYISNIHKNGNWSEYARIKTIDFGKLTVKIGRWCISQGQKHTVSNFTRSTFKKGHMPLMPYCSTRLGASD